MTLAPGSLGRWRRRFHCRQEQGGSINGRSWDGVGDVTPIVHSVAQWPAYGVWFLQ
jgi:hypothetical protein